MAEDEPPGATWKPLAFRVDETTPEVVQRVLLERRWDTCDNREQDVEDWNLYRRTSSLQMAERVSVTPWQPLNHHPGPTRLPRKDRLAKLPKHMKGTSGSPPYECIPPAFVMPSDYCKCVAEYLREKQMLGTKPGYWICKPAELSRERRIIMFSDIKDLTFDDTHIVQNYICNPLLVGHYKCDLHIYVCVAGFKPLTSCTYQEGLVRFDTDKFDLSNLRTSCAHLPSGIHKSGASYGKIKEVVSVAASGRSAGSPPTCAAGTWTACVCGSEPSTWSFSRGSPWRPLSPSLPIALSSLDLTFDG